MSERPLMVVIDQDKDSAADLAAILAAAFEVRVLTEGAPIKALSSVGAVALAFVSTDLDSRYLGCRRGLESRESAFAEILEMLRRKGACIVLLGSLLGNNLDLSRLGAVRLGAEPTPAEVRHHVRRLFPASGITSML